ncbi:peptide-methionine (S)-S-oxide reductase MsrA [Candidatus Woesearchaeota archaeon]|nr:peptide-methionine (S)-S-oxide reductase MsrA [Candidatus Woesearchaeota archaeon]
MEKNKQVEKAIFAAGCFWGVEEAFRTLPGVIATRVGYTGGKTKNPTYEEVCSHTTDHAEAVEITFDQQKISYEVLLDTFWHIHDPTTKDRQGPDIGSQYRSAIFFQNNEQKEKAQEFLKRIETSGRYKQPIVTEITKAAVFYPAEEYHQQYYQRHKLTGFICHAFAKK